MKTHKTLFVALFATAALAVSAEAGNHHDKNGGSQNAPTRTRSSGSSSSSHSTYRYGNSRFVGTSPHYSSIGTRSTTNFPRFRNQRPTFNSSNVGTFSQRRLTSENFNHHNRVAGNLPNRNLNSTQTNRFNRFANNNHNFRRADTRSHVFGRQSAEWHRDWDRHHDHWWHGHRCRWVNGSWFIFDLGFFPWFGWPYYDYYAYDYYPYSYDPYGAYGYGYDSGYYDQSNYYDQGGYNPGYYDQSNSYDPGSYNQPEQRNDYNPGRYNNYDKDASDYRGNGGGSYDRSPGALVADAQALLEREGYYRGKIDGVMGPETRHALVRYQSAKGLNVTGALTPETRKSLGLGNEVARDTAQQGDE